MHRGGSNSPGGGNFPCGNNLLGGNPNVEYPHTFPPAKSIEKNIAKK